MIHSVPKLEILASEAVLKNSEKTFQSYINNQCNKHFHKLSTTTEFDINRLVTCLRKLQLPSDVYIYTTGSDGKSEKSCREKSPIELVIICNDLTRSIIEEKINGLVQNISLPISTPIEWKGETDSLVDSPMTNNVSPSRFLHQLPLWGSVEQLDRFTLNFINEIQTMNTKMFQKFRKQLVIYSCRQTEAVLSGKDISDVNLETGTLSYLDTNGKKGTKYSLLRPIQYTLDLILIKYIRSKIKTSEEYRQIIENMPRQTPDQIDYMHGLGLLPELSEQDIANLKEAYTLGMIYFQGAQHLTAAQGKAVSFPISEKDKLTKAYQDTSFILKKLR